MENDNELIFVRQAGVLDYGEILKMIRTKLNLTQLELVEKSNISGPTIRKLEKCEGGQIATLFALLDSMGVQVSFTAKMKKDESGKKSTTVN